MSLKKNIEMMFNPEVGKNIISIIFNRYKSKVLHNKYKNKTSKSLHLTKVINFLPEDLDKIVIKYFENNKENTISKANLFLKSSFDFLSVPFNFSDVINWHYDPACKIEWKKKEYDERKIHYDGSPKDVKIVWELNRHQYFFILAKAYLLTKDDKYSLCVIEHIKSWIEQNPVNNGINWSSPMEISIRMISWILSIDMLKNSTHYKNAEEIIFKSISEHILYLQYHLSEDRLVHTNHLIGELSGLIIASIVFNFSNRDKLLSKCLAKLNRELKNQVFSDGVSKEHSSSYHRFVLDFLTIVLVFANKAKIDIPKNIFITLKGMMYYIAASVTPEFKTPMIGDADNGRGFILSENETFWNHNHVLSNAAVWFEDEYFKKCSNYFDEESFWLFGEKGKTAYGLLKEKIEKTLNNYLPFKDSGYYIIKNVDIGFYFFVRGGKYGMGGKYFSSHTHADLLAPIIYFNAKPFLIDSGTFVYNGDPYNRSAFRITEAHNNVTWDKYNPYIPKLNFGWEKVCDAFLIDSKNNLNETKLCFALKDVKGYNRTFNVSEHIVEIIDSFDLVANEDVTFNFHLHPDCKIVESSENSIVIENGGVRVIFSSAIGSVEINKSEVSFDYGDKQENLCIHLKRKITKKEDIKFSLKLI